MVITLFLVFEIALIDHGNLILCNRGQGHLKRIIFLLITVWILTESYNQDKPLNLETHFTVILMVATKR